MVYKCFSLTESEWPLRVTARRLARGRGWPQPPPPPDKTTTTDGEEEQPAIPTSPPPPGAPRKVDRVYCELCDMGGGKYI